MTDEHKKLKEIIERFDNAMLVTTGPDDMIRARPMRIADASDEGEMWFLTSQESTQADDIEGDLRAAITMQADRAYASLSGMATVVRDRKKLSELWTPTARAWFPGGLDDPDLVAIRFVPLEGAYWDLSGTQRFKYLLEAVKAVVTGERLGEGSTDRHGTVSS